MFVLIVSGFLSYGQDIIIKKDGTRINANILYINDIDIVYKEFNKQDTTFKISKYELKQIKYKSGEVIFFDITNNKTQNDTSVIEKRIDSVIVKKNVDTTVNIKPQVNIVKETNNKEIITKIKKKYYYNNYLINRKSLLKILSKSKDTNVVEALRTLNNIKKVRNIINFSRFLDIPALLILADSSHITNEYGTEIVIGLFVVFTTQTVLGYIFGAHYNMQLKRTVDLYNKNYFESNKIKQ